MAIIKCRECGKDVSDQAVMCLNCGCPIKSTDLNVNQGMPAGVNLKPKKKKKRGCLIVIIIVVLFAGGLSVGVREMTLHPEKYGAKTISSNKDEPMSKDDAGKLDEEVWMIVSNTIKMNNNLMEMITGYADLTVSELDLYDYSENVSSNLAQSSYPKSDNNDAKAYINSCKDFNLIVQGLSGSVTKYIESKETSDLSKMKKNMESVNQAITIVSGNRGLFLKNAGFSKEEIQEIADKIDDQID